MKNEFQIDTAEGPRDIAAECATLQGGELLGTRPSEDYIDISAARWHTDLFAVTRWHHGYTADIQVSVSGGESARGRQTIGIKYVKLSEK